MTLRFHEDPNQLIAYAKTIARAQTGDREEMEDAAQAALMRAMPAIRRVDGRMCDAKIRGYLRQFMVRGAQEYLAVNRRRSQTEHDEALGAAHSVAVVEGDEETRALALAAIHRLPNRLRAVAARRYWRGWTPHQVARSLGISTQGVAALEAQAADMIRARLQGRAVRRTRCRRKATTTETRGRKRLMARRRMVDPKSMNDSAVIEAARKLGPVATAMLFWDRLPTQADCKGLFLWDALALKAALMPHVEADVAAILAGFEAAGLLVRYEAGGVGYGWIRTFEATQEVSVIEKRRGPRFPEPVAFAGYRPHPKG